MITGRGGMGSHKHGISGYAPRSPRYKFTQTLRCWPRENDDPR